MKDKLDKCTCEEPIIIFDDKHLFEMCYRCNKLRDLTKMDMWIKNNFQKFLDTLK
jgi:hypothetical protein